MKLIREGIWVCVDCLLVLVNGDDSGIEGSGRRQEVFDGVERLGPHIVGPNAEHEFSWVPCACCKSRMGGSRHEMAQLGPG